MDQDMNNFSLFHRKVYSSFAAFLFFLLLITIVDILSDFLRQNQNKNAQSTNYQSSSCLIQKEKCW